MAYYFYNSDDSDEQLKLTSAKSRIRFLLRAAEVLVDGSTHKLIHRRETYADLVAAEPWAVSLTSLS